MFKTLDDSIAKEKPATRARIIANGDKLAAKRDAAVKKAMRLKPQRRPRSTGS